VLTRDVVHEHPQVRHNGIIVEDEHPVVGLVRQARPPERMDGSPSAIGRPAPTLGQHTDEVLEELGFSAAEIGKLRATGALGA
jgi:crotonobetainyl-CoA:carnitine CoA-transferase CaiB-like acyl-CoA transferase